MKIRNIYCKNVLSFDELRMDLENVNFIVGPNNSGKSNVIRILDFVLNELKNKYSYIFMPEEKSKNRIRDIVRFNDIDQPFKIEVTVQFNSEEMDRIKTYFMLLGKVERDLLFRNLNNNSFQNNTFIQKMIDKNQDSDGNISENKKKEINGAVSNLFYDMWIKTFPYILKKILPENSITFVIDYKGIVPNYGQLKNSYLKNINNTYVFDDKGVSDENLLNKTSYNHFYPHYIFMNVMEKNEEIENILLKNKNINLELLKKIFNNKLDEYLINGVFDIKLQIGYIDNDESRISYNKEISNLYPTLPTNKRFDTYNFDKMVFLIYITSFALSENTRYHRAENEFIEYVRLSYNNESYYLPSLLYYLKNSIDITDNRYYREIEKKFYDLTHYNFDIVSDIKETIEVLEPQQYSQERPYRIYNDGKFIEMTEGTIQGIEGGIRIMLSSEEKSIWHSIEYAGAGLYELLYILTIILGRKNSVIFIDEPALNLHPIWQKGMIKLVMDHSSNNQISLITHSPYLLPTFMVNSGNNKENIYFGLHHFSIDNNQTKYMNIDFKKAEKKILKTLELRKSIFFSNLNIIVEGPSDVNILNKIIDSFKLTDQLIGSNIEIVQCYGDRAKSIFKQIKDWNMPCILILDHDKKNEYLKFDIDRRDDVLLLLSDIEGTIILGNFLCIIKEILDRNKLEYKPALDIEKFGSLNKDRFTINKTKVLETLKLIDESKDEKSKLVVSIKALKDLCINDPDSTNNIDAIINTINLFDKQYPNKTFKDMLSGLSKGLKDYEFELTKSEISRLSEIIPITIDKLGYYKKYGFHHMHKEDRSIEIINHNVLFDHLPEFLLDFVQKSISDNKKNKLTNDN